MVLWSAGWCYLLLALFYLLLDVIGLRFLGWFFVVIGVNSIFAYMIAHLVNFSIIAEGFDNKMAVANKTLYTEVNFSKVAGDSDSAVGFVGGLARYLADLRDEMRVPLEPWNSVSNAVVPLGAVLILWLILLYMFRKRTFVKV